MPKGQKGPGFSVKEERQPRNVIVVRMSTGPEGMQVTVRGSEDTLAVLAALERAHALLSAQGTPDANEAQLALQDAA
jgi:hypothetical protein